jgi:hypothetical protein
MGCPASFLVLQHALLQAIWERHVRHAAEKLNMRRCAPSQLRLFMGICVQFAWRISFTKSETDTHGSARGARGGASN